MTAKVVPAHSRLHHSLTFLLHHPRRCFILLFPSINTWYLTIIQTVLYLLLWICWLVLQINFPTITSIPPGTRVISGLYQATAVRSTSLYLLSVSEIAPALLVLYTGAMYISALPVIISIRSTNVYEERSLGVRKQDKSDDEAGSERSYIKVRTFFAIPHHLRSLTLTDCHRLTYKDNSPRTPGGSSSPSSWSASSSATPFRSHPPASPSTTSSSRPCRHSVSSASAPASHTTAIHSAAHGTR